MFSFLIPLQKENIKINELTQVNRLKSVFMNKIIILLFTDFTGLKVL